MSIQETNCVVVICDGCKRPFRGYEDEYTVHFDGIEAFVEGNDEYKSELAMFWLVDGDTHLCPDCWCKSDGHPLDPEATFTNTQTGEVYRYCRCGRHWPHEETA